MSDWFTHEKHVAIAASLAFPRAAGFGERDNRFPQIKDVNMEYCWGGRLCLSRNSVSIFDEIDTNVFSACCQNGLGTAKGTTSGKLAAELACGHSSDLLSQQLSYDEPTTCHQRQLQSWVPQLF